MRARLAGLALLMLLAGCNATGRSPHGPASITLAGVLAPHPTAPAPAKGQASIVLTAAEPKPPAPKLQCDAPSLDYLIGRPRTDIPVPADFSRRRVSCTNCPPADDRRPDRTDILFDARTGLVTAVTCG